MLTFKLEMASTGPRSSERGMVKLIPAQTVNPKERVWLSQRGRAQLSAECTELEQYPIGSTPGFKSGPRSIERTECGDSMADSTVKAALISCAHLSDLRVEYPDSAFIMPSMLQQGRAQLSAGS